MDELRNKANNLPELPGVYIMLDDTGEVIYVGKAKQLKHRVSSYFRGGHDPKTEAMVSKVRDFNVIVAKSEFEALVLENSLIKRHQPRYNIILKDDKSYPFIRLDIKSEYPRFTLAVKPAKDGAKYFGPYGGRGLSREIIDTISKTLKLPVCGKRFPRDIGKERPCLNYHMDACAGYCLSDTDASRYAESMKEAVMILEGRTGELKAELEADMEKAADELKFELAAAYRDRIKAIASLANRQKVISAAAADTDAIGFYRGAKCAFTVLHYVDGSLAGKDAELFDEPTEPDGEAVSSLVRQYYAVRSVLPKTILLPVDIEDAEPLEQMFTETAGRRVYIETPKRGDRLRLVEAAGINAREESLRFTTAAQRRLKTLEWLRDTLELPTVPERIEAIDVSNTGSFGVVAAMTVYHRAKPLKRDYRKFEIKEGAGQDDYGSMREVLRRRFTRYLDGDEKFGALPDLILIDGGHIHALTARETLNTMGIDVPVFGMVKDSRHKTRALVSPDGGEIGIQGNIAVFSLIGQIQEETHRFAIEYHRSLRTKTIGSELDSIKGVGKKRRGELLKRFKTVKAIRESSLEELRAVLPKDAAASVYEHFHENGKDGDDAADQTEKDDEICE